MITKNILKSFLEEICSETKFLTFEFESAERFTILIKCQVEENQTPEFYSQYASEWINKFSKFTSTTWIVRQCFRKLKRLLYRKIYVCHRSSFNKSIKPDFATRNQECKAKVEFRMKFINRNTIKNDPLLKEGLNLTISIDFIHSHKVHAPEAFMLLKSTSETDQAFLEYFDNGCSALAAKKYHELVLIDKYGEECSDVLSNATINPTLRHVTHLYTKKKKEFGGHEYIFAELIPGKKIMLKAAGHFIDYMEDDYGNGRYWNLVTIITPTMRRVLTKCNLDHLWLDYVNIPNGDTIFFFYVPSTAGPLPAACFIQNRGMELLSAISMIKVAMDDACGKDIVAKKMVFSDLREHRTYSGGFTDVKIMTSRTWLCGEIWRWLNDDDNKLERKKRQAVMVLIKSMIHADSLEDAEKMYNDLRSHKYVITNAKLAEYVEQLWVKRDQWLYLEEDKHLTNDFIEMIVRLTREFIVQKCKGFNMCLMIDVVTNIMEKHFRRLLLSIIKRGKTVSTITKFLDKAKIVLGFGSDVRRVSSHEFRIEVNQAIKRYLHFRTDTMCCDCVYGKKGQFCDHLAAIVNIIECKQMKNPVLTEEEINLFTYIVGDVAGMDEIKPEIIEEMKSVEISNEIDNLLTDLNLDKEIATEPTDEPESESPYPESEAQGHYYHLDIKIEPEKDDPLEEEFDDISDNINEDASNEASTSTQQPLELKRNYENALKSMNNEFRRLNKLFRNNPNKSNLTSMTQLTSELSKIRPVEKVNLTNIQMKLNDSGKKRRLS